MKFIEDNIYNVRLFIKSLSENKTYIRENKQWLNIFKII